MNRFLNYFCSLFAAVVIAAGLASTAEAAFVVLNSSADATIFESNGVGNEVTQGAWTDMRIRWQGDGTPASAWGRNHPLVKFDLSGLPVLGPGETLQVNSARFGFWAFTSDDAGPSWPAADDFPELAIYANATDWSEAGGPMPVFDNVNFVTTDSIHPDGITPVKFTAPDSIASNAAGWLYFDAPLTAAVVQLWADGALPNYGIQIRGTGATTDTSRYLHLSSKEGGVAPQLVVDYTILTVPEPASLALVGCMATAALLSFRRRS